jgi:hypothetical protein
MSPDFRRYTSKRYSVKNLLAGGGRPLEGGEVGADRAGHPHADRPSGGPRVGGQRAAWRIGADTAEQDRRTFSRGCLRSSPREPRRDSSATPFCCFGDVIGNHHDAEAD